MKPECAASQGEITAEIAAIAAEYRGTQAQPRLDYPPYRGTILRHPTQPLVLVDPEEVERWAPCFGHQDVDPVGHRRGNLG